MCLEVYAPCHPIVIPYEQEIIQFKSPTSFIARHLLLIENAGPVPIGILHMLYPRYIMEMKPQPISSLVPKISSLNSPPEIFSRKIVGDQMSVELANPNDPTCGFPYPLDGVWDPKGDITQMFDLPSEVALISTFYDSVVCKRHQISCWIMRLENHIPCGGRRWFQWEINIDETGTIMPDAFDNRAVVFHEITSPSDVRRTIREKLLVDLQNAASQCNSKSTIHKEREAAEITKKNLSTIAGAYDLFHDDRDTYVKLKYYELTVATGDPKDQMLYFCVPQGDIRWRAGNPSVGPVYNEGDDTPIYWEPRYDWKSGELLEPKHPFRGKGFTIRLGLLSNRNSQFLKERALANAKITAPIISQ